MRPSSGRARAGTGGSQGSHGRGHSRHLSASSIGSSVSALGRDDRRRPPPLIMANDSPSRNRLSLDTLRSQTSTPPGQYSFLVEPSDGPSTPTSTTYSNGQNSPGYGSSLGSPVANVARTSGYWDGRSHARRLSVPSGPLQMQSPQSNAYPSPYLSPLASSNASSFSNFGSSFASPTSSTYGLSQRDAEVAEIRRRTWHPSTYTSTNYSRPATSGLSYYQTPDAPRPAFAPQAASAASQQHRLPGIETFDQIPRRPATPPPPRGSSPMQLDPAIRPPIYPGPPTQTHGGPDRRGHASWDMSLHQNLTKLDIAHGTPTTESGAWAHSAAPNTNSIESPARQLMQVPPVVHQEPSRRPDDIEQNLNPNPNRAKRQGMYIGHVGPSLQRTSPGDSSGSEGIPKTPLLTSVEHHPSIMHSNGYIEQSQPSGSTQSAISSHNVSPHSICPDISHTNPDYRPTILEI